MNRTAAPAYKSTEQSRIAEIAQQLYELRSVAYICIDQKWIVREFSNNLVDLGFEGISVGVDVTEVVDFMVGADIDTKIELPLLCSPTRVPISVSLLPDEHGMTVLICDAAEEFSQRAQLQQKANENQILLETQAKLMNQLEQAQQQLRSQNQQLQEASRIQTGFMSGFSHEFRTPLSSIIGHVQVLQAELKDSSHDAVAKHLIALDRSSKHMLSLVENLLDHGKFNSDEIELYLKPCNLKAVFDDLELLVGHSAISKGVALSTILDFSEQLIVLIDEGRFRQCLINLVSNAIKFTDDGEVDITAEWEDEQLVVSIKDTGIGINSEHLKLVGAPFWQAPDTGRAGTGLGLTITQRIIELMGGEFCIYSLFGEGTKVKFSIPAPVADAGAVVQDLEQIKSLEDMKILFAEDDDDVASFTIALLEEYGININRVNNGESAVREIEKQRYDLVLMDLHMPIMNGFDAVEAIREKGNSVPILIMTASSSESDRDRAQRVGCEGFLVKPVEISDLLMLSSQLVEPS